MVLADNDAPTRVAIAEWEAGTKIIPGQTEIFDSPIQERVSGQPIGRIQILDPEGFAHFDITTSDSRFEINSDNQVSLKEDAFFSVDDVSSFQVELTVALVDRTDANGSAELVVWIPFESTGNPWQNSDLIFDVSDDGDVTALDALRVINELNRRSSQTVGNSSALSDARPLSMTGSLFDTSGDGQITALDSLRVINELNRAGSAPNSVPLMSGPVASGPMPPTLPTDPKWSTKTDWFIDQESTLETLSVASKTVASETELGSDSVDRLFADTSNWETVDDQPAGPESYLVELRSDL